MTELERLTASLLSELATSRVPAVRHTLVTGHLQAAYGQGAEEMRERAAQLAQHTTGGFTMGQLANRVRALPIDPAKELLALQEKAKRLDEALWFIESRGYRRCDVQACNCPYWHGGHAERRLGEIEEVVEPENGEVLLDAVKRHVYA